MDIVSRFLEYTTFDTQSKEDTGKTPSTSKQLIFANFLKKQLEKEGLEDVCMDELGYVYATLSANVTYLVPVIGFIAHYDTSPDCSGKNVQARIIKNYDGKDIILDKEKGIVTSVDSFPELLRHVGEDIIVTDGHTLLGADDKSGIAAIVQAMVYLKEHNEIKHGKIRIAFNPDEEIGLGAHHFNVQHFGCDWAYTIDGGELGELEFENFNAAVAKITIKGVSVHPGYAKDKMKNAARIATEFAQLLPQNEIPEKTSGYEGFFHLLHIEGSCEEAILQYIIRDHNKKRFEDRKKTLLSLTENFNKKYGTGAVVCQVHDQYYNMREKIDPFRHIIEIASEAMKEADVLPHIKAIRGGTDGAQLSFMGLPCPNIFAGGLNFHGPHEFLPILNLKKAMEVIINIARKTLDFAKGER